MPIQTKAEQAVLLFQSGFNCAQSVVAVFCENYGLSKEMALKLTCGMGGGFRAGEICGVVSGAVLVVGLKYGHSVVDDKESKARCYKKTIEFMELFKKHKGSCVCRELLGCDPSTPEGREKAVPLFATTCVQLITHSVNRLEELGY